MKTSILILMILILLSCSDNKIHQNNEKIKNQNISNNEINEESKKIYNEVLKKSLEISRKKDFSIYLANELQFRLDEINDNDIKKSSFYNHFVEFYYPKYSMDSEKNQKINPNYIKPFSDLQIGDTILIIRNEKVFIDVIQELRLNCAQASIGYFISFYTKKYILNSGEQEVIGKEIYIHIPKNSQIKDIANKIEIPKYITNKNNLNSMYDKTFEFVNDEIKKKVFCDSNFLLYDSKYNYLIEYKNDLLEKIKNKLASQKMCIKNKDEVYGLFKYKINQNNEENDIIFISTSSKKTYFFSSTKYMTSFILNGELYFVFEHNKLETGYYSVALYKINTGGELIYVDDNSSFST